MNKWIYDDVAFVEDENNVRIAMTYRTPDGMCNRNGRLMAAAPEMFDLLVDIRCELMDLFSGDPMVERLQARTEALLKKINISNP